MCLLKVVPHTVEFWRSGGASRLHDRVVYTRHGAKPGVAGTAADHGVGEECTIRHGDWTLTRLAP
jgi:hypothetical protein